MYRVKGKPVPPGTSLAGNMLLIAVGTLSTQLYRTRQDSSNSEVKANNFILLEPSLRLLGVQFDAQVAYNVMQGKLGTAGRLLYQVWYS